MLQATKHAFSISSWGRRQHTARGRAAPCRAVAAEQLAYWDVVEYRQPTYKVSEETAAVRLGLVQDVEEGCVHIAPLVEEDEGIWVPEVDDAESPEHQQQIPAECVLRVIESSYGQRQDKEHNPHGEHAHDVWQVLVPLTPGVFKGYHKKGD